MRTILTPEQKQFILINYAHHSSQRIADILRIKVSTVYNFAHNNGLLKTKEYKREMTLNTSFKAAGERTRFKTGHEPHNKGKKLSQATKDKLKRTNFPKGHVPYNTQPVGTIVTRKDVAGRTYQFIKISNANWMLLQRAVWMNAHGPIPKGSKIRFKDGNTMNCELDNLEMITEGDLMKANSFIHFPKEVIEVIRLRARLNRKINKLSKNGKKQNE